VVGHLAFPGVIDRVFVGAAPWTRLTELPVLHGETSGVDFDGEVELAAADVTNAALLVRTLDHCLFRVDDLAARAAPPPATMALFLRFQQLVCEMQAPRVLEIGARARTGVNSGWLPEEAEYVGFDIVADANVQVVGDAHKMSQLLPAASFDAAYSLVTFEHLAMPWVVAAELNRVLKTGAYVLHISHQTWPLHEAPWDFFRFSEYAWASLFNKYSGFEICEVASALPAVIFPKLAEAPFIGMEHSPGYLGTAVLARKIGETDLRWDVDVDEVVAGRYPD
jgi:hypothetical protein